MDIIGGEEHARKNPRARLVPKNIAGQINRLKRIQNYRDVFHLRMSYTHHVF